MNVPPIPACPECGGPWLEGFRWQHVPLRRCPIRAADDATQAADAERATGRAPMVRPSTPTEGRLWALVTGSLLPADAVTVVHRSDYWFRAINGHDSAATAALTTTPDPEGTAA